MKKKFRLLKLFGVEREGEYRILDCWATQIYFKIDPLSATDKEILNQLIKKLVKKDVFSKSIILELAEEWIIEREGTGSIMVYARNSYPQFRLIDEKDTFAGLENLFPNEEDREVFKQLFELSMNKGLDAVVEEINKNEGFREKLKKMKRALGGDTET